MTHWFVSAAARLKSAGGVGLRVEAEEEPQGVERSESRTPFSRASCSRVIGMNEPYDVSGEF